MRLEAKKHLVASNLKTPIYRGRSFILNPSSALSLFMFGVFADDSNDPLSLYDFTFITDFFDGCPDFHFRYPVI